MLIYHNKKHYWIEFESAGKLNVIATSLDCVYTLSGTKEKNTTTWQYQQDFISL